MFGVCTTFFFFGIFPVCEDLVPLMICRCVSRFFSLSRFNIRVFGLIHHPVSDPPQQPGTPTSWLPRSLVATLTSSPTSTAGPVAKSFSAESPPSIDASTFNVNGQTYRVIDIHVSLDFGLHYLHHYQTALASSSRLTSRGALQLP